jgi:hypothetical protein
MVKRSDGQNQLVQHGLPATGGASGSPIVNRSGEVVAVLSGVNMFLGLDGVRIPNAAGVNYAQRADFVADLLNGNEVERTEQYARDWESGLHLFASERQVVFEAMVAPYMILGESTVTELSGVLSSDTPFNGYPAVAIEHEITEAGVQFFFATSETLADLDMVLMQDGQILAADDGDLPYAMLRYEAAQPATLSITVLNYAAREKDTGETPFTLRVLAWPGEPSDISEKLLLAEVASTLEREHPPELVSQYENVPVGEFDDDLGAYASKYDLRGLSPGFHLFYGRSDQSTDPIKLAIVSGDEYVGGALSEAGGAAHYLYAIEPGATEDISVVIGTDNSGARLTLKHFVWPPEQ